MRSKRERMKSAAVRFSSVSVSRPRNESPARKKRSARRSSCRIDSFCGARCWACIGARNELAMTAKAAKTAERFSIRASIRVAHAFGAKKIHQPSAVVRHRRGDVVDGVAGYPVVGKVRRRVYEEIGRRGGDQRDFRQ